jgi:hypothetical protein
MSKAIRNTLNLVLSLLLLTGLTMAQAGGKTAAKNTNKEHHSRISKVAFWRHNNKDAAKNTKQAHVAPTSSKTAATKPAQLKTASVKQTKKAQLKSASVEQTTAKKDQKPAQHASKVSTPSAKKTPSPSKAKAPQKGHDPKAVSMKQ